MLEYLTKTTLKEDLTNINYYKVEEALSSNLISIPTSLSI